MTDTSLAVPPDPTVSVDDAALADPPPNEPQPAHPRARPLVALVAGSLALAAILWGLTRFTEFRTDVVLTVEPSRVVWDVNGTRLEAPMKVGPIDEIAIEAADTPFTMGGRELQVDAGGETVVREALPRVFAVKRGTLAPLGDWSVDERMPADIVYRLPVSLHPTFVLRTTFTGRCLKFTSLRLRQTQGPSVLVSFRRGLINNDAYIERGEHEPLKGGGLANHPWPHALNALDLVLRGLIAAALTVAVFAALALVPLGAGPLRRLGDLAANRRARMAAAALVLLASFAITTWVAVSVLEGVVHTPDEVAYQLQTRWLRAGRLYQEKPPIHDYLHIPFTFVKGERWMSQYPIGWPMLLALGDAVGRPWLVNPILGMFALLMLIRLGMEIGDARVGLMAALFAALSPMWQLMFGSRLSHGATACAVLAFAWLFLRGLRTGGRLTIALAGITIGFAAGIRPLTALAVAVPFGLFWLLDTESRRRIFRLALPFVGGAAIGLLPVLIANARLTGSPWLFAYTYVGNHDLRLEHVHSSVTYLDATLASTLPVLTGWGWGVLRGWPALLLPIGFALAPFVLGRATRRDVLLASTFTVLPLAYLLHNGYGLHGYGPRFYFEGFFALYLLAARGLVELSSLGREDGRRLTLWAATALVVVVSGWNLAMTRTRLSEFRGYNIVSGDLERALREKNVTHGVVLLPPGDWYDWGRVANLLPADPTADLVFAQRQAGDLGPLLTFYKDRPLWAWDGGTLQPFRP